MEKIQYKIDVFEGPMDLLLYLIGKHKLNINDIPILELVEQYTDYVRQMQESDMEVASEFVEMAARLVYLKTVSLLPVHEEEAQQLKRELTGELIEYRDCKAAAQKLSENTDGFDCFERKPMVIARDLKYKRLHEAAELLKFYIDAVGKDKTKLPVPMEAFGTIVAKKIVSVNSKIVFIYRKLLKKAKVGFTELFEKSTCISDMVATFLAVLELVKENKVMIDGDGDEQKLSFVKRGKEQLQ